MWGPPSCSTRVGGLKFATFWVAERLASGIGCSLLGRQQSGQRAAAIAFAPAPRHHWLVPPSTFFTSAGIDEEGLLGEKKRRKVLSVLKETVGP